MFRESANELRKVQAIAVCGIMGALAIVLGYVATIRIGDYIRVGFSFLPNVIIDFLYGPVVGGIFGGVMDVVKYIMNPTGPFFPGFTISAIVGAVIYGIILYRQKVTILRVFMAQLLVKVVVNLMLNTVWLVMLYGYGLAAILPGRIACDALRIRTGSDSSGKDHIQCGHASDRYGHHICSIDICPEEHQVPDSDVNCHNNLKIVTRRL